MLTWLRSLTTSSRSIRKFMALLKVSGSDLCTLYFDDTVNLNILSSQLFDLY